MDELGNKHFVEGKLVDDMYLFPIDKLFDKKIDFYRFNSVETERGKVDFSLDKDFIIGLLEEHDIADAKDVDAMLISAERECEDTIGRHELSDPYGEYDSSLKEIDGFYARTVKTMYDATSYPQYAEFTSKRGLGRVFSNLTDRGLTHTHMEPDTYGFTLPNGLGFETSPIDTEYNRGPGQKLAIRSSDVEAMYEAMVQKELESITEKANAELEEGLKNNSRRKDRVNKATALDVSIDQEFLDALENEDELSIDM